MCNPCWYRSICRTHVIFEEILTTSKKIVDQRHFECQMQQLFCSLHSRLLFTGPQAHEQPQTVLGWLSWNLWSGSIAELSLATAGLQAVFDVKCHVCCNIDVPVLCRKSKLIRGQKFSKRWYLRYQISKTVEFLLSSYKLTDTNKNCKFLKNSKVLFWITFQRMSTKKLQAK